MQHCHGKKPNEELEKQYRSEIYIYVQCKCFFSIKWSKIGADAALPTEKRPTAEVNTNSTGQASWILDSPPDLFQITFTRTAGQTFL